MIGCQNFKEHILRLKDALEYRIDNKEAFANMVNALYKSLVDWDEETLKTVCERLYESYKWRNKFPTPIDFKEARRSIHREVQYVHNNSSGIDVSEILPIWQRVCTTAYKMHQNREMFNGEQLEPIPYEHVRKCVEQMIQGKSFKYSPITDAFLSGSESVSIQDLTKYGEEWLNRLQANYGGAE